MSVAGFVFYLYIVCRVIGNQADRLFDLVQVRDCKCDLELTQMLSLLKTLSLYWNVCEL